MSFRPYFGKEDAVESKIKRKRRTCKKNVRSLRRVVFKIGSNAEIVFVMSQAAA